MAAAMNGMALHGGVISGRRDLPGLRRLLRGPPSASRRLMGIPVVYVMTHDSIGLGEDGPTHQPVEHLASLRAMPNMRVFRPADAIETAECWQLALERTRRPEPARADAAEPAAGPQRCGHAGILGAEAPTNCPPANGKARATIFASG